MMAKRSACVESGFQQTIMTGCKPTAVVVRVMAGVSGAHEKGWGCVAVALLALVIAIPEGQRPNV
jgi:hypothetical protein